MIEFRVQGPPGTGKTFWLSRQIEAAATSYGGNFVSVCSLTRAAAANIAQAGPAIPPQNIGTIHSLAYAAVSAGNIAETKAKEFNRFCDDEHVPSLKLSDYTNKKKLDTPNGDELMATVNSETAGDHDLSEMNRLRAKMRPEQTWPASVRAFKTVWDRFKQQATALDFTDLLEISLRDVDECPGKPAAIFVDESQDCSRLAFALMRKWGSKALKFIHVGDPDQILFEWAGVDPGAFFSVELPESQTRTLHQSYRVPRQVHALAVRWIEQTPGRKVVDYKPREYEGEVRRDVSAKYRDPMPAVRDAVRHIEAGKTVMFVASCSYMLESLIEALRAEGIPFHNPYRTTRCDWNPLSRSAKKTSAADRLLSFVKVNPDFMGVGKAKLWTYADVARWMDWIVSDRALVRGAKSWARAWAEATPDDPVDTTQLVKCFNSEDHVDAVIDGRLEWYGKVLPVERYRQLKYPASILRKRGVDSLRDPPRCIVTTIHAVKGGEADVVYLFPDLSPQAQNEWMRGGAGREGVRRAFYVGVTRARETLVILKPSSSMAVNV